MTIIYSLGKKLALLLGFILLLLTVTFFAMKAIPGDPFQDEQGIPPEVLQNVRAHWGLEDPLWEQYKRYITACATFTFGPSLRYQEHRVEEIIERGIPISFYLGLQALLIAIPFGILIGWVLAMFYGHNAEAWLLIFSSVGVSIPTFVSAASLQYFFGILYPLFPVARWGSSMHTVLPSLALALIPTFQIARLMRASLIEVYRQPYIWTARMKGLTEFQVFFRHALKNSILPLLGFIGPTAANILVGSFVVERIFGIPGLGQWFVNAVLNRDYPLIGAMTLLYSVVLFSIHIFIELVQIYLDPRKRTHVAVRK